ncbi:hypothetical protein COT75_00605 [Candidatus Beckwithbacteria bacterium CG10_big_fil_rev_8_21_14_0_10_34_10]|uniref:Type II secretion system protein GspG C-terminal domain-containing protein n=1 Tax=Candidatus Beckwithbacteria bacterium CG10_big_fil_rev_8_21_14_0_10_34_10 TaxID=1974495 RepID=A0A2H0WAK2_9BACT|nr:MAG: hypothetical protein COT75_00605 [Candidatus Beckwithbacteria bacterium CG10_big_fil_rev_8_21_14_0_10_34_10]
MKLEQTNKQGFTLLELLVAIFIMGVLTAMLLANFQDVRSRGRDTKRKTQLIQVKNALRIYYNDNQQYPADDGVGNLDCSGWVGGSCTWGGPLIDRATTYMTQLPEDPFSGVDPSWVYFYESDDTNGIGEGFNLYACLENDSDTEAIPCPAGTLTCSVTNCYKVTAE